MHTKEKLLRSALDLFLRHGYERTSMIQIARHAGISKPGIYHHFQSKEILFQEVLDFFFEQMKEWSIKRFAACTTTHDLLHAFFQSLRSFREVTDTVLRGKSVPSEYSFLELILAASKRDPQIQKKIGESFMITREHLAKALSKAQQRGEIRSDLDPEIMALHIHALIEGLSVISYLDKSVDVDAIGEDLFRNMWILLSKATAQ